MNSTNKVFAQNKDDYKQNHTWYNEKILWMLQSVQSNTK